MDNDANLSERVNMFILCSLARTYPHPQLSRAIIRAIRLLDGRSMLAY